MQTSRSRLSNGYPFTNLRKLVHGRKEPASEVDTASSTKNRQGSTRHVRLFAYIRFGEDEIGTCKSNDKLEEHIPTSHSNQTSPVLLFVSLVERPSRPSSTKHSSPRQTQVAIQTRLQRCLFRSTGHERTRRFQPDERSKKWRVTLYLFARRWFRCRYSPAEREGKV
jgi:hypothetical protein